MTGPLVAAGDLLELPDDVDLRPRTDPARWASSSRCTAATHRLHAQGTIWASTPSTSGASSWQAASRCRSHRRSRGMPTRSPRRMPRRRRSSRTTVAAPRPARLLDGAGPAGVQAVAAAARSIRTLLLASFARDAPRAETAALRVRPQRAKVCLGGEGPAGGAARPAPASPGLPSMTNELRCTSCRLRRSRPHALATEALDLRMATFRLALAPARAARRRHHERRPVRRPRGAQGPRPPHAGRVGRARARHRALDEPHGEPPRGGGLAHPHYRRPAAAVNIALTDERHRHRRGDDPSTRRLAGGRARRAHGQERTVLHDAATIVRAVADR